MQDAYAVDNMTSQRTLRPKRKGNWRKLQFGEDIPTDKPRLARTFPDTFEVERLISNKSVKNEVILFSFFFKHRQCYCANCC